MEAREQEQKQDALRDYIKQALIDTIADCNDQCVTTFENQRQLLEVLTETSNMFSDMHHKEEEIQELTERYQKRLSELTGRFNSLEDRLIGLNERVDTILEHEEQMHSEAQSVQAN